MAAVGESFRRARIQAFRHMAECERAHFRWSEPTITEMVIAHASRAVSVVPFTQPAEAVSGADWVWWWVDDAGAFGMLVQAKHVTVAHGEWSFDFGYRTKGPKASQVELLRSRAAELGVLPVYALYLGNDVYRERVRCAVDHRRGRCLRWVKRAVSLMPARLADGASVNSAESTYRRSVALEDMWCRQEGGKLLVPKLSWLAPELRELLEPREDGTNAVTRSMIERILSVRADEFNAVPTHRLQTAHVAGERAMVRRSGTVLTIWGHGFTAISSTCSPRGGRSRLLMCARS